MVWIWQLGDLLKFLKFEFLKFKYDLKPRYLTFTTYFQDFDLKMSVILSASFCLYFFRWLNSAVLCENPSKVISIFNATKGTRSVESETYRLFQEDILMLENLTDDHEDLKRTSISFFEKIHFRSRSKKSWKSGRLGKNIGYKPWICSVILLTLN